MNSTYHLVYIPSDRTPTGLDQVLCLIRRSNDLGVIPGRPDAITLHLYAIDEVEARQEIAELGFVV